MYQFLLAKTTVYMCACVYLTRDNLTTNKDIDLIFFQIIAGFNSMNWHQLNSTRYFFDYAVASEGIDLDKIWKIIEKVTI